jgi:poly(3-hydroxybutyrate) depolymerase
MASLVACGDDAPGSPAPSPSGDVSPDAGDGSPDVAVTPDVTEDVPLGLPGDTCPTALDGVCDEPLRCLLGTDPSDCMAACADEPGPELYGACLYLESGLPDHSALAQEDAARGSGGSGGRAGRWYGVVDALDASNSGATTQRYYSVFVPSSYDPARPTPVIYYGGGFGDEMYHTARYTDLEALAERNQVIIAYVQQDHRDFGTINYQMAWYVYLNAFAGGWFGCPDLSFYIEVLEVLEDLYNVDRTRVFLSGTSRGGGMSIMLSFLRPDLFAGFISQAGFIAVNDFDAFIEPYEGRHMAAVLIAGNQDTNVQPWESEEAAQLLTDKGWGERLMYLPVEGAGHQWQTHLTQRWWDFLYANPIPLDEVAP